MLIGKVIGSVVSTRKQDNLVGNKFTIVEPLKSMNSSTEQLVAIDNIGAGVGEIVLVAQGSAARVGSGMTDAPIDAAIVGIVDSGNGIDLQ
ncbi:MAG: EutN/CcmL family microcompartment protein [Lachnospiraceae bacterium]